MVRKGTGTYYVRVRYLRYLHVPYMLPQVPGKGMSTSIVTYLNRAARAVHNIFSTSTLEIEYVP